MNPGDLTYSMSTSLSKPSRLNSLLTAGYFPMELPPPFGTLDFGKYAQSIKRSWLAINNNAINHPNTRAELYSYPQVGISRRRLSLVNPISQFWLSDFVADNWVTIRSFLNKSVYSEAKIEIIKDANRSIELVDYKRLEHQRVSISSSHAFILKTDVSRFYPTLYTHVIPWALHDKKWCKQNLHSPAYHASLGNLLDILVRKGQENQTLGIPIGPDTSRILSEIVASAIDQSLQKSLSFSADNAYRHIDDWFTGFPDQANAERALVKIGATLKKFELEINFDKTAVVPSGRIFEPNWVYELRNFEFPKKTPKQKNAINEFFNMAFAFSEQLPHENILLYALQRVKSVSIAKSNWEIFQNYCVKCQLINSTCWPLATQIFVHYNSQGFSLDRQKLSDCINYAIEKYGPIGYHGEVAWALFLAKSLNLEVGRDAAYILSNIDSSVCALLTLDLNFRGQIPSGLDLSYWTTLMATPSLYNDSWLLAYEADLKGWLPGGTPNFVTSDPYFSVLKNKKVSFYNISRNIPTIKQRLYHLGLAIASKIGFSV